MSLFAVTREASRGWAHGGIFDQPAVEEHAAFMNALAAEGFVLFAGPLADTAGGRARVLLIVDAEDEAAIRSRFAEDPWVTTDQLRVVTVEPWRILVGAERIAHTADRSDVRA